MNRYLNKMFSVLTILALMLMALPMQSAQAAPTELFFSEYIEGSSNNKALEIYNGTGAAVNLTASSYNVQMYFNGSASAGLTINLTGTVANGDVFVLAQASANATILAQADQTNGAGWFNGDDAVVLRKGTTVIDVIGQIGFDPGTEWGSGLTSTADNTLNRKNTVCAGDPNGSDAFNPSVEWDGFATDTFAGLGAHTANCDVTVSNLTINDVSANEGDSGTTSFDFTVSLSAPAGPAGVTFDIATADSTATIANNDYVANSLTGQAIPAGSSSYMFSVAVNGDTTVESNETFFVNVTNVTGATVVDGQGQGTIVNDDVEACGSTATFIHDIQGNGLTSPINGASDVSIEGIVVGDFQGSGGLSGYYVQEEDVDADADSSTSEGIFVFNTAFPVSVGDMVRVKGNVVEFETPAGSGQYLTELTSVSSVLICNTGNSLTPTNVTFPVSTVTDLERFEGMLVNLPQALVISEYFNYERFGEMVLALPLDGETRAFTPTSIDEPGAAAQARALANSLRRITLDDGLGVQNPSAVRHPNGGSFALNNRFRGGDIVQNTVGVMDFSFGLYRIQPTGPADYTSVNPRSLTPEPVGGSLRVAAMNTLNFFLTLDTTVSDSGPGPCGGNQNLDCRGADANQPQEFVRQRDKLLAALSGLNGDVIGLNELENTPGVDPLGDPTNGIVAGLNTILGAGTYAYIDTGVIGTDAIRVGLIYKPANVVPVGSFKILDSTVDPRFIDTRSRPALAQTFEEVATGARFTVVVNHLKSKGSACTGDPDIGDGQGNCNQTRKAAAQALVDWIATDPTGSGDADYIIMGDLNSYAQEDPIDAIKAGADDIIGTFDDYTNLIFQYQGTYAYSYVFDGQAGYLDHALAFPSLTAQVTGAADWHINADEPDLLDYDTSFKPPTQDAIYEPNAYRSSDHDPVVVGLDLLHYNFSGFFQPVDNAPVFNSVKGGTSIPVKFSLGGNQGLDIFLNGYPLSRQIACSSGAPLDEIEQTVTAGGSTLSYDPSTDQYTYVWKTNKSWAGTCRQLVVILKDGSIHYANFSFK